MTRKSRAANEGDMRTLRLSAKDKPDLTQKLQLLRQRSLERGLEIVRVTHQKSPTGFVCDVSLERVAVDSASSSRTHASQGTQPPLQAHKEGVESKDVILKAATKKELQAKLAATRERLRRAGIDLGGMTCELRVEDGMQCLHIHISSEAMSARMLNKLAVQLNVSKSFLPRENFALRISHRLQMLGPLLSSLATAMHLPMERMLQTLGVMTQDPRSVLASIDALCDMVKVCVQTVAEDSKIVATSKATQDLAKIEALSEDMGEILKEFGVFDLREAHLAATRRSRPASLASPDVERERPQSVSTLTTEQSFFSLQSLDDDSTRTPPFLSGSQVSDDDDEDTDMIPDLV